MNKVKADLKKNKGPELWAIGGGKGGVGKSVICTLLALWLARKGHQTILIDADLGGANLHTLLGMKIPPRTLNDFITKKYQSLEDICVETEDNLRLISGASEVLSLANPLYVQKTKIIQGIHKLDCDYVVMDLGAGSSFNVLDFFLISHRMITVLTPQPTAIQNAYGFIRNAAYRRMSQMVRRNPSLDSLVKMAMNPKNDRKIKKIQDLLAAVEEDEGADAAEAFRRELGKIRPAVITNMAREETDKNANRIVQIVSEKYLTVQCEDVGSVAYDIQIEKTLGGMTPLTKLDASSQARAHVEKIALQFLDSAHP